MAITKVIPNAFRRMVIEEIGGPEETCQMTLHFERGRLRKWARTHYGAVGDDDG